MCGKSVFKRLCTSLDIFSNNFEIQVSCKLLEGSNSRFFRIMGFGLSVENVCFELEVLQYSPVVSNLVILNFAISN